MHVSGERAGKYRIETLLGAGGMGEVWKAWDTALGRWVALKFLRGEDAEERERFRREARTAAKLSHPGIAPVYEAEEGFIAMRLVDGPTLAKVPRHDTRKIVEYIRQAADAIHYAHEQGIVHRDLKPANLMIENDRVFVMDFGLAKARRVDRSISLSGTTVGTPAYMSPEQARGRRDLDGRADVYSLGATLYELLANRAPLHDSNAFELLKKVIEEDPPPLRTINRSIDRDLETIVMRCLEKEPGHRYSTARELAEDLGRWLAGEAILAHPPSVTYRLNRFVGRRRGLLIATAAAALTAVAAGVWLAAGHAQKLRRLRLGLQTAAEEERDGRLADARDRYRSLAELDAGDEEARAGLARVEARIGADREEAARKDRLREERDRRRAEALKLLERGRPAVDQATQYLYNKDANYEELARRVDEGLALIDRAIELAPDLPQGHYLRGLAWEIKGWDDRAEAGWREAVRLDGSFGPAHYRLGRRLMMRAFHARTGYSRREEERRRSEAERFAREAAREIELASAQRGWDDDFQRAIAAAVLAYCRGDPAEMVRISSEGLEKFRASPGVEEFHWLRSLASVPETRMHELDQAIRMRPNYGVALCYRGQEWAARGELERAFADYSAALRVRPRDFIAWLNRGNIRFRRGDPAGAIADYDRAIEIDPSDSMAYCNRGLARRARGDPQGAIADQTEALRLDPENETAYVGRGQAQYDRKDYEAAIADYTRAVTVDPVDPLAYYNRGNARHRLGDDEAAIADYGEAIRVDPRYSRAWYNRGVLRAEARDWERAIDDLGAALKIDPGYLDAWTARGTARRGAGDLEGAIADYTRALDLAPRDWSDRAAYENEAKSLKRELERLKGLKEN